MAHITIDTILTTDIIVIDIFLKFPIEAGNRLIEIIGWISSVILKIVCIHTKGFIMFSEVEGTELCFIVEHVEIFIKDIVMDKLDSDLFFIMSKRAIISIFAFVNVIRVMRTEFFFIG